MNTMTDSAVKKKAGKKAGTGVTDEKKHGCQFAHMSFSNVDLKTLNYPHGLKAFYDQMKAKKKVLAWYHSRGNFTDHVHVVLYCTNKNKKKEFFRDLLFKIAKSTITTCSNMAGRAILLDPKLEDLEPWAKKLMYPIDFRCMCMCAYVRVHICECIYACVRVHVCMYANVYAYMHLCACVQNVNFFLVKVHFLRGRKCP